MLTRRSMMGFLGLAPAAVVAQKAAISQSTDLPRKKDIEVPAGCQIFQFKQPDGSILLVLDCAGKRVEILIKR